jgi:hypothetical protein
MARYAFPVRLSHPLLNAGLSRRSKLKHALPGLLVAVGVRVDFSVGVNMLVGVEQTRPPE